MSMITFPFEQIGWCLEKLARMGGIANGISIVLWIGISMIPFLSALLSKKLKKVEKGALTLLSFTILVALYGMVNPGSFCKIYIASDGGGMDAIIKAMLSATVWSVFALFIVIRLTRLFGTEDKKKLFWYIKILLYVFGIGIVLEIILSVIMGGINLNQGGSKGLDFLVEMLRFSVNVIPLILDIMVIRDAIKLVIAFNNSEITNETAENSKKDSLAAASEKLCKTCSRALGVSVGAIAAFNLLQVLLSRYLSNVLTYAKSPITSLVFAGIVFLMARLMIENKELKEDNDLFI